MTFKSKGIKLHPTVEIYHDVVPYLAGISSYDFFMSPVKCAQAWRDATSRLKSDFGDLFPMRKPSPAPLSYGHLVCLGAPVSLPKDGEPNIKPFASSLDEGIEILHEKKGSDFTKNEWFSHYLATWCYLKEQFPADNLSFSGFGVEGPLTSAVLMRGQDFLMDLYDEPEKSKLFLELLADSVIDFVKLTRRINKTAEIQDSAGIADDFSSLVPPAMWPDFVLPFLDQQYAGLTKGKNIKRYLHMENLSPGHLPLLKELKLNHFQPSVSNMLTLADMKDLLDPSISFDWLLYSFHITAMTDEQIQEWVDETVAAGVSIIRTQFGAYAYQINQTDRIKAFFRAFEKYRV